MIYNILSCDYISKSCFNVKASESACEFTSFSSPFGAAKLSKEFEGACLRNGEELSLLKWQYFASAEGVTTVFPSPQSSNFQYYNNQLQYAFKLPVLFCYVCF